MIGTWSYKLSIRVVKTEGIVRANMKILGCPIPYGREAQSLAEEFDISKQEAQEMIDGWLGKYHGAADYLKWCAEQVQLGNFLETPFGRRRRFGLVTPQSLHGLQNEAKNFPIQSSSSDLLLWCCIKMEDILRDFQTAMLNLVHDSTVLEIPADVETIKAVGRIANEIMTSAPVQLFDCPIPFKTDFEIGLNWGELVTFDYVSGNVVIEHDDDSIEEIPFVVWYNQQLQKETINE